MIRHLIDANEANELLERHFPGADLTDLMAEPLNCCLAEGDSGAFFAWRGPNIYEIHLFFAVKGREALNLFSRMLETMRNDRQARFFWAAIPVDSRHVRLFARWTGFKPSGVVQTRHGPQELFVSENEICPSL